MENNAALKNAIALAWDSILAHKLRSFLTLLGVIIGVASVILVGSAIDGFGRLRGTERFQGFRQPVLPDCANRGGGQYVAARIFRPASRRTSRSNSPR